MKTAKENREYTLVQDVIIVQRHNYPQDVMVLCREGRTTQEVESLVNWLAADRSVGCNYTLSARKINEQIYILK